MKVNEVLKGRGEKKKYACSVLITCDSPSEEGNMDVELTFDGDPVLAAYLVEGAHSYFMSQQYENER